jgi:TPR repeat protein
MPSFLSVMVLSALLFTGLFLSQTNAEPMPNANGGVKQQIRIKAEKGYAEAQNNLGVMYVNGNG